MSKAIDGTGRGSTLYSRTVLDRVISKNQTSLSELQSQTDRCVGAFISETTNLKTLSAFLGAGAAYRLTRMGTLTLGSSSLIRGGSLATGLAAESAVFTGAERVFHGWDGHAVSRSFSREWAKNAVNLGSLRFFGGLARSQNLILQHLAADVGMVGAHHLAHAADLAGKPQGSLAAQMASAEALTWQMRAGMSLAHGLSPSLSAAEKTMDLSLRSREASRPSSEGPLGPLAVFAGGPSGRASTQGLGKKESPAEKFILNMATGEGEGPKGSGKKGGEEPLSAERTPLPSTSENPGSSETPSLLQSLRKYLLIPKIIWRGIRAPKDQTKAWDRYWSSIQSTGRKGEVHWDSESQIEMDKSLERLRTHTDFNLPILDLGCGNGRHSRILASHFPKVLGIDISSQAIEKAHQETPDGLNVSYRVFDLTVPGGGKKLAREIGETNIYVRGVLHILDAKNRAALVESMGDLLGEKGVLYFQETNYQGSLLKYMGFMGVTLTSVPTPLRRAIESGIRPPGHIGASELQAYFPETQWEHLASGKTDLHAVPLKTPHQIHLVPGFFALVRRRRGE